MLTRRKDSRPSAGNKSGTSSDKPCDTQKEITPSTSSSRGTTTATAGSLKRKSDDDPHDEKGTEFLRRKHNFIKSSILVDYQPDICKDYKETGFCGFGDSCKFLHDRSDYKHGWQLEQEWANNQHKDEDVDKYLIKDSDDDEDAQEAAKSRDECPVCKDAYKQPVETKCKHRFCEKCFDENCIETCFVCHKATGGVQKPVQVGLKARK